MGIYKITNLITNEFYIGQAKDIYVRFQKHSCQQSFKNSSKLDRDICKYGKDNFKLELVQECTEKELKMLEEKYILELKPYYNVVYKGCKRDKEFKKKVSVGTKKWWDNLSEQEKQKVISNNLKGPKKGHKVSEETRGKLRSNPNCRHYKKVKIIELDLTFNSVGECEKYLQVSTGAIARYFKRKQKTIRGYHIERCRD